MIKRLIPFLFFLSLVPLLGAQSFEELEKLGGEKMANGHYSQALDFYQQAIALISDKNAHATTYAYAGMCALELGDNSSAKGLFIAAIKRGIEESQVFDNLGSICRKEKDYETQIMAYKAGVERLPSECQRYQLKLCYIYKKQKADEQLLAASEEVLLKDAQNWKALEYKGTALQYQKKMGDAEKAFSTLYNLDPKNINANIFLGNYYYQVGRNKLSTSRKKYEKIPKPTRVQWHEENEKSKATMEKYYRPASKHLQFVNDKKPNSSMKKMLFTMYTKLGESEKAALYKAE